MMLEIRNFLEMLEPKASSISNERALQLELGYRLRDLGYRVEFEKPFAVNSLPPSTRKPKQNLDLLIVESQRTTGIELKVPLAGRVPETMYDFCADVEFVEGLIRLKLVDRGLCILVTNNRQFWQSSTSDNKIYKYFRNRETTLSGSITKPTGAKDTAIFIGGRYQLGNSWRDLGNHNLMKHARYLLVEVNSGVN